MSKAEALRVAAPSPQYLAWLARERRGHLIVRVMQLAVLIVFLVLWEVLPKAHIINQRTVEIFRHLGISDRFHAVATPQHLMANNLWVTTLAGLEVARSETWGTSAERAADYRATRPKVERKLAHLVRRRHGGRRVRVRGLAKVAADFSLLAAAVNLARLGVLGLRWTPLDGWVAAA